MSADRKHHRRKRKQPPYGPILPDLDALLVAHKGNRETVALALAAALVCTGIRCSTRVGQTPDGPRTELGFELPTTWRVKDIEQFKAWVAPWVDDLVVIVLAGEQVRRESEKAAWN